MDLNHLLSERATRILDDALQAIARSHLRSYEKAGGAMTHERLRALFVLTARGVKEKNLGPMIAHAEEIARERYASGYDLWEVQTAFNVLEEAIWLTVLKEMKPEELAEALGLVSTVLGAGKDALARSYVSLASKTKAPSLNLQSMFSGI